MKKKFLFGFSVICVSAAFWACGDDSTVSGLLEDLCEGDESCAAAMSSAAGALSSAAAASSAAATSSAAALSSSAVALSSSAVVSSSSVAGSSSSVGTSSSSEASSSSVAPEPEPEPVGDYKLASVTCAVAKTEWPNGENDYATSFAPGVPVYVIVKEDETERQANQQENNGKSGNLGFAQNGTSVGASALSNGAAKRKVSDLTKGDYTFTVTYNGETVCTTAPIKVEPPKITANTCKIDIKNEWTGNANEDVAYFEIGTGFTGWEQIMGTEFEMTLKMPSGEQKTSVSLHYNPGIKLSQIPTDGQTFELIYEGNTVCTVVAGQEPATPDNGDNGDNTGDNGDNTGDNGDNTGDNGDDTGSEGGESGSEGEGGEGGEGNSEGGEA